MQIADGLLLKPPHVERGENLASVARPLVIEPWISPPPDVVVYEFGARLDNTSRAAAAVQIQQARQLYYAQICCIRIVHAEMNAWVLERAGPRAQALQAKLTECGAAISVARAGAEVERLHLLAP
jgi:hypothetical protein